MTNIKCAACGLVNFATSERCRRCGDGLVPEPAPIASTPAPVASARGLGHRFLGVVAATVAILTTAHLSLLATSEGLSGAERAMVVAAVDVLDRTGFAQEARGLRHLASFRHSDNWWNRSVGHATAYAATNFPFGVVTLYPSFFILPVDDTERAAILLHESRHLLGDNEAEALQFVWREKQRLGWSAAAYARTRVWTNTREWTMGTVPGLFACGDDRRGDCLE